MGCFLSMFLRDVLFKLLISKKHASALPKGLTSDLYFM